MLSAENFAAIARYRSLDPRKSVPASLLQDMAEVLDKPEARRSAAGVTAANIHLELAIHGDASPDEQYEHAQMAQEILHTTDDYTGSFVHTSSAATMLRTHLPLFVLGNNGTAQRSVKWNLQDDLNGFVGTFRDSGYQDPCNTANGQHNYNLGRGIESVAILILGHVGVSGLMVRPSFERHESGTLKIRGQSYNSDLTAISNGATVPEGEYRLQVKSKLQNNKHRYHRDIIMIGGEKQLNIPRSDPRSLAQICDNLIKLRSHDKLPQSIKNRRDAILTTMRKKGPLPRYE